MKPKELYQFMKPSLDEFSHKELQELASLISRDLPRAKAKKRKGKYDDLPSVEEFYRQLKETTFNPERIREKSRRKAQAQINIDRRAKGERVVYEPEIVNPVFKGLISIRREEVYLLKAQAKERDKAIAKAERETKEGNQ